MQTTITMFYRPSRYASAVLAVIILSVWCLMQRCLIAE